MKKQAILLQNPYPNGVAEDKRYLLKPFMNTINEIFTKITNGEKVYIRIVAGERKGSIAYIVKYDDDYRNPSEPITFKLISTQRVHVSNPYIKVILGWDGRKNRIKWSLDKTCEYLPNYEGFTVWKKFDKKAAAEKKLKETPILDRDGKTLQVGDRLLYLNARYGCAAALDRGTIEDIYFNVQRVTYNDTEQCTLHVIIKNDNGEKSDIKNPELTAIKIEEK